MIDITSLNGTPLSSFGAVLLDYDSGSISFTDNFFKAEKRLKPTVFDPNMPLRDVKIKCEFKSSSDAEAEASSSELALALTKETELLLPDGFYYNGVLVKAEKPKRIAAGIFTRQFNLKAFRHGALEQVVITQTSTINVKGNYPAMVKYTIEVSSGDEFSVDGISVAGITGSTIVIDGIDGLITEDGENCFEKTDLVEFPCVTPGEQTIEVDGNGTVTIEYYPIYF